MVKFVIEKVVEERISSSLEDIVDCVTACVGEKYSDLIQRKAKNIEFIPLS